MKFQNKLPEYKQYVWVCRGGNGAGEEVRVMPILSYDTRVPVIHVFVYIHIICIVYIRKTLHLSRITKLQQRQQQLFNTNYP